MKSIFYNQAPSVLQHLCTPEDTPVTDVPSVRQFCVVARQTIRPWDGSLLTFMYRNTDTQTHQVGRLHLKYQTRFVGDLIFIRYFTQ